MILYNACRYIYICIYYGTLYLLLSIILTWIQTYYVLYVKGNICFCISNNNVLKIEHIPLKLTFSGLSGFFVDIQMTCLNPTLGLLCFMLARQAHRCQQQDVVGVFAIYSLSVGCVWGTFNTISKQDVVSTM